MTCVDKSNVLRTMAFFRKIVTEVSSEFPEITLEYIYSDACAQAMVLSPEKFDVLVMENFLGDLLSDLGGATVGGIGLCHSGNYGSSVAYFLYLIHILRCRRLLTCRSRWSPYH